jgi:hypothetical protein
MTSGKAPLGLALVIKTDYTLSLTSRELRQWLKKQG